MREREKMVEALEEKIAGLTSMLARERAERDAAVRSALDAHREADDLRWILALVRERDDLRATRGVR